MLRIVLATLFLTLPAHASITDQEILLAPPTPPAQQSNVVFEETRFPYSHRFTLGVGSGLNTFSGNLGKLYSASSPVVEIRGEWALAPTWSLRVGGDFAKYSFNAEPNGPVGVDTKTLRVASQSHFLSTALASEGWDPYFALSGEQVFRTQSFRNHNSVEKDNAFAVGAGLGTNYVFRGGKLGLWAEAGAGQVFFKDRYEAEYIQSGIEDTTGLRYSGRLGVKYLF